MGNCRQIAVDTRNTEYEMAQLTNRDQLAQLQQLFRKRQELIESEIGEDDSEFAETNRRIEQIINDKPSYSIKSDKQEIKQLEAKASSKFRIEAPLEKAEEKKE